MVSLIESPDFLLMNKDMFRIRVKVNYLNVYLFQLKTNLYHRKQTKNSFYHSRIAIKETVLRNLVYVPVLKSSSHGVFTNLALWNCHSLNNKKTFYVILLSHITVIFMPHRNLGYL